MTVELAMVAATIALGMVQLSVTAMELRRVHGVTWANTARDEASGNVDSPLLGRLQRAQANLMETLVFFVGLVLVIHVAGLSSAMSASATVVFFVARLLHFPLYALGVPWLRGLVWTASFLALIVLAWVALSGFVSEQIAAL